MATTTTTTPDALPLMTMAETSEYVEKHRIKERLEEAMNAAVRARSEDPLAAIAAALTAAAPSAEAAPEATGEELVKLADTLRENMELGFDPKDHTEAEVLQVVADAKRVVECGTALAAKVKDGTITPCPGRSPCARSARISASVPDEQLMQCLVPAASARRVSMAVTSGPMM